MAKGTIGKANVIKKIKEAFGADFIGEYDRFRCPNIHRRIRVHYGFLLRP